MSHAQNEIILENAHADFEEAIENKDYEGAQDIIDALMEQGFNMEARDLHFDLLSAKEQEVI